MAEAKFKETDRNIHELIEELESPNKRKDAYELLELFSEVCGQVPKVWAGGIIGFGSLTYETKSGRCGDSPIIAFAPRKTNLTLYLGLDSHRRSQFLTKLGKHRVAKLCIYINKLADVDMGVLREMIAESYVFSQENFAKKE
jgi:hypothetical protein